MARPGGAVLMAVRTGARFLPDQSDSLRDQPGPPLTLVRHDDGAAEIIAAWAPDLRGETRRPFPRRRDLGVQPVAIGSSGSAMPLRRIGAA